MESQYKDILGEIEVEGTVMNPDSDARRELSDAEAGIFPPTQWETYLIWLAV